MLTTTIARACALSLTAASVFAAPALALPFSATVSGGPVDTSSFPFNDFTLVAQAPVSWQGPFAATGYDNLPVTGSLTTTADVSFVAAVDATLGTGFSYLVEVFPLGGGVVSDQQPIERFADGGPLEVTTGTTYSFSVSDTLSLAFTLDVDPDYDFATEPLFFISLYVMGADYEDSVQAFQQLVSFAGEVTVGQDAVPEPSMIGLLGLGAIALGLRRRRA